MRSPQVWTPPQHHYGPGPLVLIKSFCPGRLVPVRGKSDCYYSHCFIRLSRARERARTWIHLARTQANAPRPLVKLLDEELDMRDVC